MAQFGTGKDGPPDSDRRGVPVMRPDDPPRRARCDCRECRHRRDDTDLMPVAELRELGLEVCEERGE